MEISGNTVLITGGMTGIGYAIAEAFLEARNEVIICGRLEARLLEAQKKHSEFHIKRNVAEEAERRSAGRVDNCEVPQIEYPGKQCRRAKRC